MEESAASPTNSLRQKVLHDYHDHAQVADAEIDTNQRQCRRGGGVTDLFPKKLHLMLSKVEESGLSHIVSWQPHGRCFVLHKPKEFEAEVLQKYFRQSKLTSFQRQLNLYRFARITQGPDRGGYYHELFLRQKLFLCEMISRVRIKGTGVKAKTSPETEPDFYSMPLIKADDALTILNTNFEGNSATAFEDKIKLSNPALNKKKHAFNKKYCVDRNVFYSPVNKLTNGAPKTVTPVTGSKKELLPDPSSSFGLRSNTSGYTDSRHASKHIDTCPPLLSSCSKDSNDLASSSWRESAFDKILSDSALMVLQSLHEPILSPSSSSFSLDEMSEQQGSLEINTDTIFSDQGFDGE